jgi:hypothetical protein
MRQTKIIRTFALALLTLAGCSASSAESRDAERLPEATHTPGYERNASTEVSVRHSTGVTLAGLGVEPEHIRVVVPLPKNMEEIRRTIREEIEYKGVSVIIPRRECIQTAKRHNAKKQ